MFFSTTIVLSGVFVAFFALVLIMRAVRRMRSGRPAPPMNVDFSMADLQAMLDQGQLTPEEFERARDIVLRRAAERDADADRSRGHAFEVIQNPPPLPVQSPPPPDGDPSRDAR